MDWAWFVEALAPEERRGGQAGLSTQIPPTEVARPQCMQLVPDCAEWCKDLE